MHSMAQNAYASAAMEQRRVASAGTLAGDRVRNAAGEDVGQIEEIMLDVRTGRVAYAVLSLGRFRRVGCRLFPVPWEALTVNGGDREFILDIDTGRLENAPGFDEDDWPNMADTSWGSQIHDFYGMRPYWEPTARKDGGSRPRRASYEFRATETRQRRHAMQNQNGFRCDGCGKQFNNRNDLQKHERECTARQGSGQGSGRPMTRTAGGQSTES
jgi:sporulation protein YlmC with PRC-barrel domain